MELPKPGDVVDRYEVVGTLGQGGMAVVFEVRHVQLGTRHALKLLTVDSRSIARRLLAEGKAQATLRHTNIVAVTDVIEHEGMPGLVMEYIDGPALDQRLEQGVTRGQADTLATGILDGVIAAHALGIIHRDLKPANILLAPGWVPKIADFGLVKVLDDDADVSKTRTGSTMGTPQYMPPEQIRDAKSVDQRADVYALGAILYELACGARAFPGDDPLTIFAAVANGDFVPPREHVPDLPQRMEDAILGALTMDRDDRIGTVEELKSIWTAKTTRTPVVREEEPPPPPPPTSAPTWSPTIAMETEPEVAPSRSPSIQLPAVPWRAVGAGVAGLVGLALVAALVSQAPRFTAPAKRAAHMARVEAERAAAAAVPDPAPAEVAPDPAERKQRLADSGDDPRALVALIRDHPEDEAAEKALKRLERRGTDLGVLAQLQLDDDPALRRRGARVLAAAARRSGRTKRGLAILKGRLQVEPDPDTKRVLRELVDELKDPDATHGGVRVRQGLSSEP